MDTDITMNNSQPQNIILYDSMHQLDYGHRVRYIYIHVHIHDLVLPDWLCNHVHIHTAIMALMTMQDLYLLCVVDIAFLFENFGKFQLFHHLVGTSGIRMYTISADHFILLSYKTKEIK